MHAQEILAQGSFFFCLFSFSVPLCAAAMIDRRQKNSDPVEAAALFGFRGRPPQAFNQAVHFGELWRREARDHAQTPEFAMAACYHDAALPKPPPEIANAHAQHGTDNGGDGPAVRFTSGLVLEAQIGRDGSEQRFFAPATIAIAVLEDQACEFQGAKMKVESVSWPSQDHAYLGDGERSSLDEHIHDFLAGRRGKRGHLFLFADNVAWGSHFHDWGIVPCH